MKMPNYDMHVHTEYCGHAPGMSIEAICARADENGLETLAITDHVFTADGVVVLTAIRAELSRIKTDCRIIVGAEVDVDGQYHDGRLITDGLSAADYVVAGFHYVPVAGNYPLSPDDCTMPPKEFLKVWRSSLLGIVSNPKVDTFAHPGRLLASAVDMEVHFDEALAILAEAAEISAENNVAWELNELTGSRLNEYYQQRWYKIYEIALDAGVRLVYGSDAHCPEAIGGSEFVEMILQKLPDDCLCEPEDVLRR